MQCGNCGTENPENAVYCKHCGRRLDDMGVCSFCGGLTPADGEYCINCGANRNAPAYLLKTRFSAEGSMSGGFSVGTVEKKTAIVPTFKAETASDGGATYNFASVKADVRIKSKTTAVSKKTADILNILAFSFAAFAALLAFAFVFAVGCSPYMFGSGENAEIDSGSSYIYYFFSNVYNDSFSLNDDNFAGAVFGTVFAALGIGGTVACFVLSVIRFAKILTKKTEKTMFVPAAATVVSYICTVSFYFLCVAQSIDVPDLTGYLGLNAATISGVVLSATFLVAAVVLSAVSRGTNKDIKSYIFNSVFRGGYSALLFIVLGLIGFGFVFFGLNSYSGSNASYGILALFNNLAVSVGYNAEYIQKIYNMCAIFAGVAVAAAVALGVFAVFTVSNYASGIGDRAKNKILALMIAAGACTMVIGAMMLAATIVFTSNFEINYSDNLAVPIVVIILGALLLATAIVYAVLSKNFNREESVADLA